LHSFLKSSINFFRAGIYQISQEGRAMDEKQCRGEHSQHLCKLEEEGRFEEIKKLVKEQKYICAICKRAAASEYNLCSPVDVDASRYM
jgi:hypothetical protein